jgi:enterochelin esterase-like enzyme
MLEFKMYTVKPAVIVEQLEIYSEYLERSVQLDIYLPVQLDSLVQYSLLLINDGQDLPKMPFDQILNNLIETKQIHPIIAIGIYCGVDRKMEYGTAYAADYNGRGARAGLYAKFIFDELLPHIRKHLSITSFKEKSFAGFSLGALSALDIVWNHPNQFNKVGVFSGSLWWRRKAYEDGYEDEKDRLMHLQIRKADFYPWIKFFLQCGELDESADRNNNGIIDSIDDTLDLIIELKAKGYTDEHIKYLLLADGKHDVPTWANVFPEFLTWSYGNK